MATRRVNDPNARKTRPRRATTPEDVENQLIASATDLARRQLDEGTASAQVITHFLKLASSREKLEQERLRNEVSLLKIKREAIESEQRVEELYREAMQSFKSYKEGPRASQSDEGDHYDY